tara:strand:- start:560 stop:757 length:198 start_codon:yes stop_codon:yes gene_type:complete
LSPVEFAALVARMRAAQREEASTAASYKPGSVKAVSRMKARSLEALVDAELPRQQQLSLAPEHEW